MTTHGAAGSAAGYLYQCERALVEMLRRSGESDLTLFLEGLDDVELDVAGVPGDILQLKHHLGGGPDLTDTSVDLWRSIGVWIDLLDQLTGQTPVFSLLTTSEVPTNSAAALLTPSARDPAKAEGLLVAAARESTNAQTSDIRRRFIALDPVRRELLVNSIRVRAAEPRLEELDDEVSDLLSLHLMLAPHKRSAFIESLMGWWYARCVAMLTSKGMGITTNDLAIFVQELRDSFHPENLPPSFDLPDPTSAEVAAYAPSLFVQQLIWIAYTNEQLFLAIRDYHRAFTQRSRWARQGLLYPGEIDQYERRLVDQWRLAFADLRSEVPPDADDAEMARMGRTLLHDLRDSTTVRLRPRYSEVFLTHGTLHELSNRREVGWHPDFQRRLEQLLTGAA